ncbi:MAG: pilus assembly protein TadG-related protein, partial [Desulfobacterales bacterium]|nr:pilus assembly protein TadG-related protein [Desulfobacterales bacterium]
MNTKSFALELFYLIRPVCRLPRSKSANSPRKNPAAQKSLGLLNSEQGNFAVMFALTIMFVLTLLGWVLDTGFFFKEKNRYQDCAEAAALAAVNNVCFTGSMDELKNMVMDVVRGSSLDLDEDEVIVETGYYDAFDEYEPFGEYK